MFRKLVNEKEEKKKNGPGLALGAILEKHWW